jgi:drug/metabolite transporter (DMT)-like permease
MLCTLLGAGAQVMFKAGVATLPHSPGLVATLLAMAVNIKLLTGYTLYGLSAVLLVLALRHGELSILYPVIALTYVWVSILSVLVFHEQMSPLRIAGIATIVVGVAVLGRGNTR